VLPGSMNGVRPVWGNGRYGSQTIHLEFESSSRVVGPEFGFAARVIGKRLRTVPRVDDLTDSHGFDEMIPAFSCSDAVGRVDRHWSARHIDLIRDSVTCPPRTVTRASRTGNPALLTRVGNETVARAAKLHV
jgi:hypothetical protein